MKNENYLELCEKLVEYGRKHGADEIQVALGRGSHFSVEVLNGNIDKLEEASTLDLGLKLIVDSKVARASSSDLSESTLFKLVDNAIARAKLTSPDPFSALPEKEEIRINPDILKLYDPSILEIPPEKKIEFSRKLESIGKSDKRINISTGSGYSTETGEVYLAMSNGFSQSYKHSSCSAGVGFQAGSGDNLYEDGWWESSMNSTEMETAEYITKKAIDRVVRMIGARKVDTQNVPIVFENNMTNRMLGFLAGCVNGHSIYLNQSFLAGKLDQKIAAHIVNIYDDPLLPNAFGSRPFDSEGVPSRKITVVENGILKNYLTDTYSGRKLNMKSNAHAGGTTNFYLQPGTKTPEEIIRSVDKGFLYVSSIGQGTVGTTGDYSKGAYGMWIEKGEITYPVAEVTISGNLGKMLQDIEMIGNDMEFTRSMRGPTVKIKEMTISGK